MREILLSIFAFLILGSLSGVGQETQPKIQFLEKEHHFGEVVQGTKADCKFEFKNEGNAPLKVTKVETSCGCTAAVAGKNELAPGESSEINTTFNSAGRSGQFRKGIQVYSNDPQSPKVELFVDGMIKPLLEIQPKVLNLGLVKVGETIEREIKIKAGAYEKPLRITQIDKSAHLEVTFKDEPVTRDAWTSILVKFKSDAMGPLSERISIRFEDPSVSSVMIPVMGRVEGPIRVIPPRVNFILRGKTDQAPIQKIQLVRTDASSFQVVKVELDPQFFDVETVVKEEGKSYEVVIRLKEGTKERLFSRTLKIFTNDDLMKVIEIPVQVWTPAVSRP